MSKQKSNREYCEVDSKHEHFWERVGIYSSAYFLFFCQQCKKSKLERIKYVENYNVCEVD